MLVNRADNKVRAPPLTMNPGLALALQQVSSTQLNSYADVGKRGVIQKPNKSRCRSRRRLAVHYHGDATNNDYRVSTNPERSRIPAT